MNNNVYYRCRRGSIKMGGNKDRRINIPFEVCFCLLRRRIGPEHKKCA